MTLFDLPKKLMGGAFGTRLISHFRREDLLMIRSHVLLRFGMTLLPLVSAASMATAASDLTSTLRGFTGNSTQGATQTAVSAAGFNFFDIDPVAVVAFDASGARFGDNITDNDVDRNYMRTNDDDYANTSFVAEITIVTPNIDVQDAYFGFGSGNANIDFFRVPDYLTDNASVHYWGENEVATPTIELYATNNQVTKKSVIIDPATGLGNGTHRVKLSYDWFQKKATFSFDLSYAGGTFMPDIIGAPVGTSLLYGPDGFPTEASRIFFGGDEQVVFKDFSVDVTTPEMTMGDFDATGTITEEDWDILRDNMHSNLSSLTFAQAYFLGDLTSDKANNHDDFVLFKTLYEQANGGGSFARMLAGIPEPSSVVLMLSAGSFVLAFRRRTNGS